MLDLTTFLALTRDKTSHLPVALYCHENQFAYPWSSQDRDVQYKRDKHYSFINYISALAADHVFFNSRYNFRTFISGIEHLLRHFPDYNELQTLDHISTKSSVLPVGIDLSELDARAPQEKNKKEPVILWNHRWEHDKNPADFFKALELLHAKDLQFKLVLMGENFRQIPKEFQAARQKFADQILQYGYVTNSSDYLDWLWRATLLPVTSWHDFFGVSVLEAIYCGAYPLLPNRLAYPELLPLDKYSSHFYETFDELVAKLERVLQEGLYERQDVGAAVKNFGWDIVAPQYDAALCRLVEAGITRPPIH
jgi:glycosyltransferase involved in cell wall biosynthesis